MWITYFEGINYGKYDKSSLDALLPSMDDNVDVLSVN